MPKRAKPAAAKPATTRKPRAKRAAPPVELLPGLHGYLGRPSESLTPIVGVAPGRPSGEVEDWRFATSMNSNTFGRRNKHADDLLHLVRDADPQLSHAMWQWLRLLNNGHTATALITNAYQQEDGTIVFLDERDLEGQAVLDDLAKRVGRKYGGGMDALAGVLFDSLMREGAVALELEIDLSMTEILDFHVVPSRRFEWHTGRDEFGQQIDVLGVMKGMTFVPVSPDQVKFLPLDPENDNAYGHSPFVGAIQAIYFKAQMLRDLRMVMHVAGHPRLDVKILSEIAMKNVPAQFKMPGSEAALKTWFDRQMADIRTDYEALQPDDAFIHWDHIGVGYIGPTSSSAMNAEAVDKVLNRQIASAVKMLPLLLGNNETATETHGSIQWQVQVAGIESLQRVVRRIMEWAYTQCLAFYGLQSRAAVEFKKHRTIDLMVEATERQVRANFWTLAISQNWADNDEASFDLLGHAAVGPDPRLLQMEQSLIEVTGLLEQLTTGAPAGEEQAQDQEELKETEALAEEAAAAVKPRLQRARFNADDQAELQKIVRNFARNNDNKKLIADLLAFYTEPPPEKSSVRAALSEDDLVEFAEKYEREGKGVLWDLFPEIRDSLKESGYLRD